MLAEFYKKVSGVFRNKPVSTDDPMPVNAGYFTTPLGFKSVTFASAPQTMTAIGIPTGATRAVMRCTTAGVMWRDDGTAPSTASNGMFIASGGTDTLDYTGDLSKLIFNSTTGVLLISFYK